MAPPVHEHMKGPAVLVIPPWLHPILRISLELKLLGSNLIIMAVAVLILFGPVHIEPTRLTDALVVVAALSVGAAANFCLVRISLRPITSLTRVAWLVSEGVLGARVPPSIVADRELAQLSTTINELLDHVVAERDRIRNPGTKVTDIGSGPRHLAGANSIPLFRARR